MTDQTRTITNNTDEYIDYEDSDDEPNVDDTERCERCGIAIDDATGYRGRCHGCHEREYER